MNSNSSPLSPMVNAVGVKPPRFTPKTPALCSDGGSVCTGQHQEWDHEVLSYCRQSTYRRLMWYHTKNSGSRRGDYARIRKEILDIYTPSSSVLLTALLEGEFTHGTRPSLFFRSLKAQVTDLNLTDDFTLKHYHHSSQNNIWLTWQHTVIPNVFQLLLQYWVLVSSTKIVRFLNCSKDSQKLLALHQITKITLHIIYKLLVNQHLVVYHRRSSRWFKYYRQHW